MYGIEWGKGRVHCRFCGKSGHNITSCKHVVGVYENTEYQLRTRYSDGVSIIPSESQPWLVHENWWGLSKSEQMAWVEMTNRQKRQENRQNRKLKKKKQRCSFCRKEGHRRPSCKHYKKFMKTTYKANTVWKKQFVDLVNITGLGIGALVQIPKSTISWWMENGERVLCLITDYSMERLNVFSSYKHRDEFRTVPHMTLVDTTTGDEIKVGFDKVKSFVDSGVITSRWSTEFINVISPVKWKPPQKWQNEDRNQEIEYVLRKLSVTSDKFPLVNSFINRWNKGGSDE